jgi:hypothetical protein
MKASFPPGNTMHSTIHRRLLGASFAIAVVCLVGLGALVAACGDTETAGTVARATLTTSAVTTSTSVTTAQSLTTTTTEAPTTTGERTIALRTDMGVPYVNRADGSTGVIHVWAPKEGGPWPVVVMLHGGDYPTFPGQYVVPSPAKVAQRGAVVFAPAWLPDSNNDFMGFAPEELRARIAGATSDVAAAVRFARATATQCGGDSENVTLYGYSAGANHAAMEAFGDAPASEGALKGVGSALPESLVLYDPDILICAVWMPWDEVLARDPGMMQFETPWHLLGQPVDFPITIIASGDPELSRDLGDMWAEDSWMAVRDPTGDIRRALEKLGARVFDTETSFQVLADFLKAAGDEVTYITLSDSTHSRPSAGGEESIIDVLVPNMKD